MSDNIGLVQALSCKQIDGNHFRGDCNDFGGGHLFGGQAMAQAISAAQATVKAGRDVHVIHTNFLRPGNPEFPVLYEIQRSRDGANYSSRRIIVSQNDKEIMHLSASFRDNSDTVSIQPNRELPLYALDFEEGEFDKFNRNWHAEWLEARILLGTDADPVNTMQSWLKPKESLPANQPIHSGLLAYYSDIGILPSHVALYQAVDRNLAAEVIPSYAMSSLNHSIWFHRSFKADDWIFYECIPEYTASDRGLAHGRFYTRDGSLIASATQEGLLRLKTNL